MEETIDPILEYLIKFNEKNQIRYRGHRMIPAGGLKEMLQSYQKFHIDREARLETVPTPAPHTIEELYAILD